MIIDPRAPLLSQFEASAATELSMKAIDNYIQHGFLIPARIERRRMFSARQIARLQLVEQLSGAWQIPPKTGFRAADRLLALPICKTLLGRAVDVPEEEAWVFATVGEERVSLQRDADGDLAIVPMGGESGAALFLSLTIAPHGFIRSVLWRCCKVLAATASTQRNEPLPGEP